MKVISTINNAVQCSAAAVGESWQAAAVVYPDVDSEFFETFIRLDFNFKPGKDVTGWNEAQRSAEAEVVVLNPGSQAETIAKEKYVNGISTDGEGDVFVAAWTGQNKLEYFLNLFISGKIISLRKQDDPVSRPAVVVNNEKIYCAVQVASGKFFSSVIFDQSGKQVYQTSGINPRLVSTGNGQLILSVEKYKSGRYLTELHLVSDKDVQIVPLRNSKGNLYNCQMLPLGSEVWVLAQACPCWGYNELIGQFKELALWKLDLNDLSLTPGPGTVRGVVPLPQTAFFNSHSNFNHVPENPRLFIDGSGIPAIGFRQFRNYGDKCFGWDTFISFLEDGVWSVPCRFSPDAGTPDQEWSIASTKNNNVGFFPCCDQVAARTFQEIVENKWRGQTRPSENFRLEIVEFGKNDELPEIEEFGVPKVHFTIPPSLDNVAPNPPQLDTPYNLVWGDLHAHSAYSKCMSANDGMPEDVLRYQRDALGNKVLTMTEHVEYLGIQETVQVFNLLDEAAGADCLKLYGCEWGMLPAHHTNFYTLKRDIFMELRTILLTNYDLSEVFAEIKKSLPENSVIVIRHYHGVKVGEYGTRSPKASDNHDPELELAYEAMQVRGNMMLPTAENPQNFPAGFFNAGKPGGLVGGTDHCRGWGPNHLCLTGFFLDEFSPAGLFRAIKNRKTIAMANGKTALFPKLGEHEMGAEISLSGEVRIKTGFAAARPVGRACLIRDGEVLEWVDVNRKSGTVELIDASPGSGQHWYSVTLEGESVYIREKTLAHASPFFVNIKN